MPSYLQNLQTIRDNFAASLVSLSADIAAGNPKPSYSIGSRSVQWVEYLRFLTDQLELYNKLLQQADPFEIKSIIA